MRYKTKKKSRFRLIVSLVHLALTVMLVLGYVQQAQDKFQEQPAIKRFAIGVFLDGLKYRGLYAIGWID